MVGHWEVDYHRDVGIGTTFPDVSDDDIVVDADFPAAAILQKHW